MTGYLIGSQCRSRRRSVQWLAPDRLVFVGVHSYNNLAYCLVPIQLTRRKSLMLKVLAAVCYAPVLWCDSDTGVWRQRHVCRNTMSNPASHRAAWPRPWTGCEYQRRQFPAVTRPTETASNVYQRRRLQSSSDLAAERFWWTTARRQGHRARWWTIILTICSESESATYTAVGRRRTGDNWRCAAL